jgi:hypothetical protein
LNTPFKAWLHFLYRLFSPLIAVMNLRALPGYVRLFADWREFRAADGECALVDLYPCLGDWTVSTAFDRHYFYQQAWAIRKIYQRMPVRHVDVGSDVRYVAALTAFVPVEFVDIRPLDAMLENWTGHEGSILDLPYQDQTIVSLSCISVAEHIGLGRYGDPIDPEGTQKACRELARVLAAGGDLYFGLPVGVEKVCFNAHRIMAPQSVLNAFPDLVLVDFSVVDDNGKYLTKVFPADYASATFANGLFHFRRPEERAG